MAEDTTISRPAPKIKVLINGGERPDLAVMEALRFINFQQPDTAILTRALARSVRGGDYDGVDTFSLQNIALRDIIQNDTCEIMMSFDGDKHVIHYGRIVAVNANYGPNGDVLTYTSRFDKQMFGAIGLITVGGLDAKFQRPDPENQLEHAFLPIVFNPVVDGKRIPNQLIGDFTEASYRYTTPEALPRHADALDQLVEEKACAHWTLSKAVHFVCRSWNRSEKHVLNPTLEEIQTAMGGDGPELFDVKVDHYRSLPEVLTRLLQGYGFNWHIHYVWQGKRQIVIDRRQAQSGHQMFGLQKYGDVLDVTKTKISKYEMQFDIGNRTITHAAVVPEVTTVEATFELVPAWDPQYDTFPREQLDLGNPDLDQAKRRVWRDWVLNESGEYTEFMQTRNEKNGNGQLAVDRFDFEPIFDRVREGFIGTQWFHRRRRFGRLLTIDTDGSPLGDGHGGVWVEFWTKQNELAGVGPKADGWQRITKLQDKTNCTIGRLKNECGIRFTSGARPLEAMCSIPMRFADAGKDNWESNFKLRVTAVVEMDHPDIWDSDFAPGAPTGKFLEDVKLAMIDGEGRFRSRQIDEESLFHDSEAYGNTAAHDMDRGYQEALDIYQGWGTATCSGSITTSNLQSVDTRRMLGKSAALIYYRNIHLTTAPKPWKQKRYPTVVGVKYNIQKQQITISLDTLRRRR